MSLRQLRKHTQETIRATWRLSWASNTDADDRFGYSVSVSGDALAVGAYLEDSNATGVNGNQDDNSAGQSGAVYLFQ